MFHIFFETKTEIKTETETTTDLLIVSNLRLIYKQTISPSSPSHLPSEELKAGQEHKKAHSTKATVTEKQYQLLLCDISSIQLSSTNDCAVEIKTIHAAGGGGEDRMIIVTPNTELSHEVVSRLNTIFGRVFVISAMYGHGNTWIDVTRILRW